MLEFRICLCIREEEGKGHSELYFETFLGSYHYGNLGLLLE